MLVTVASRASTGIRVSRAASFFSNARIGARRRMTSSGHSGIQKVTVVGCGTLGTQVSLQTAITGHDVTVLDVSDDALNACKANHESILQMYIERENDPTKNQARAWTGLAKSSSAQRVVAETLDRLTYTTDPAVAMEGCELVSENVPEVPEIKASTYKSLMEHASKASDDLILTTNSSTLLPSDFVDCTGDRKSNFLALHFANGIWEANLGEVMPHPETDEKITEKVLDFAKDIGMVPFYVHKEQNGYIINSLLVPWLNAAQTLVTNGVSSPTDVDKAWLISTGGYHHACSSTIRAPFIIMDVIGIPLVSNVMSYWGEVHNDEQMKKNGMYLKLNYVDKGKHGITNGDPNVDKVEGIYSYPHPEYMSKDFMN